MSRPSKRKPPPPPQPPPRKRPPKKGPPAKLSLAAIRVADLVRLLTASGAQHLSAESIRADLAAGAPANPDGTVNLIHYTAWLARHTQQ